jgi:hypothetical protein
VVRHVVAHHAAGCHHGVFADGHALEMMAWPDPAASLDDDGGGRSVPWYLMGTCGLVIAVVDRVQVHPGADGYVILDEIQPSSVRRPPARQGMDEDIAAMEIFSVQTAKA